MKLELKNLKIHKDMSEETICFSATLYADGQKVGTAKNNGQGGPNMYYADNLKLMDKVEAFVNAQDLAYSDGTKVTFEKLDFLVNEMIGKAEDEKYIKNQVKKGKTVFRLKGAPNGEFKVLSGPRGEKAEQWIRSKYGDQVEAIY